MGAGWPLNSQPLYNVPSFCSGKRLSDCKLLWREAARLPHSPAPTRWVTLWLVVSSLWAPALHSTGSKQHSVGAIGLDTVISPILPMREPSTER